MRTKRLFRITLITCCLASATGMHAFWGPIVDVITKTITDAAAGQATRLEQLSQIKHQLDQLDAIRDQTTYLIQHSKQYSGDNAWRASVQIRKLERQLRKINANGRHITADAHDASARLLAVLPTDADFNAARTAAERDAYAIRQDIAARDALRDALKATMDSSQAIHRQMSDASSGVEGISRDLSRTDSQLAALQLIGAATTQNAQQLQTLTKAVVAQTDLLMNVYARELAAQDRRRGQGEKAPRTKIVPAHLVDDYRRRGHEVQPVPDAIDQILTETN